MKKRLLLFFLVTSCLLTATAQQTYTIDNANPRPYEITSSRVLKMMSVNVAGQEYELDINLPGSYKDSVNKRYPVLYVLDSQWDFPLVTTVAGAQNYDGFIPEVIIVGIQWIKKDPSVRTRERDFTPTHVNNFSLSGGAPNFLAFIKKELIPFIDANYRTASNDRTLMGSSYAGLFTLYTMFTETALFGRYILTGPSLWWDNGMMYTLEKNYQAKTKELPVRLYMGVGEFEGVTDFQKFVDHLKAQNYKGLELKSRVLDNIGHGGTKPEGYTRGLQWVFEKPAVKLSKGALDKYIGTYELNANTKFKILVENEQLVMLGTGTNRYTITTLGENDFFMPGHNVKLLFNKDASGKVTGFRSEELAGGRNILNTRKID